MKMSMWTFRPWILGPAVLLLSPAISLRAHAFGGLWSAQNISIQQSSERIIFVDNPDSTVTAIVEIKYEGPAEKFAWVIPVPGTPTVGFSSSTVFERLDAATAPEYWLEQMHTCTQEAEPDAGAIVAEPPPPGATSVVTTDQGSVGPYDYVNLTVDSAVGDPATVATDWFAANGYAVTSLDEAALGSYLKAGLNLLAFKLTAGADAGAIRPVVITYESELPTIPIRATRVAAHDDMGIQVWVIGPSQAVPDNYASLVLNDARIDWLSARKFVRGTLPSGGAGPFGEYVDKPDNYAAVVTAAANEAGGHGFVTELASSVSQFREKVWAPLDRDTFMTVSTQSYPDGLDALLNAHSSYGSWDGWNEAARSAITLPAGVSLEDFGRDPEHYRGVVRVDTTTLFEQLDARVIKPIADTAALFYNAPYLTRLYTTMSAAEMTIDPAFDYNFDLAQVSPVHIAKQAIECDSELGRGDAPWRMELPQGGIVAGEGSNWPVGDDATPANLKVVTLSAEGSGKVVTDNTGVIRNTFETAASGSVLHPPQIGLLIGATQTVVAPPKAGAADREPSRTDDCSASHVGADTERSPLLLWSSLALLLVAWRRRSGAALRLLSVGALLLAAACSGDEDPPVQRDPDAGEILPAGALSRAELRDPETCKGCHPIHYREWASSMHAYAARDPVFLAMNERGQRETHGELGDFCVKCHAPMAVVDKRTKDGLNLADLPDKDRGVSCYFCHNVESIEGEHNAMLHIANDRTMRGPIADPISPVAHQAEHSDIFEDNDPKSSAMCGGCHDIVTPLGVELERTFAEYRNGLFSRSATGEGPAFESCVSCHMPGQKAYAAAVTGAPLRDVHEHLWPGVDVPLVDFPNSAAMRSAVEDCQLGTASISFFKLEVTPPNLFTFQLETNAGHNQPSGASQDRRMWLELLAYDANGNLIEDASSGNIADNEIEEKPVTDPAHDPHLLMLRDRIFDARGKPVHMFWEAEKSAAYPDGYQSVTLPGLSTTYIEGKHAVLKQYKVSGPNGELPARVTARLRMRAIGMDVLQSLVESGDLDPNIAARMPTLSFGAQIEWTPEDGMLQTISAEVTSDCRKYRCLLDPSARDCQ